MRVIYMGTPLYARIILERLHREPDVDVTSIYTQPDRPVGRKQVLTPPEVKVAAQELELPCYQPENINDPEVLARIRSEAPDFIVVAAYGQLLKQELLDIAPCINLHASILPAYRGASPIQETLLNGDALGGVTAMRMELGLDSGEMLGFIYHEGVRERTSEALMDELAVLAGALCIDVLKGFKKLRPLAQKSCDASHVKKRTKQEAQVEFSTAVQVDRKYRAFYPWPGVFLESKLAIKSLQLHQAEGIHKAGEILAIEKDHVLVGCLEGSLRIETLQAPSKNPTDAPSYLRGKRLSVGDILS